MMDIRWQQTGRLFVLIFCVCVLDSRCIKYSDRYSFLANRDKCDGVCTYCKYSDDKHQWTDIQRKLSWYTYTFPESPKALPFTREAYAEIERLINWSWTKDVNFNCMIGIISLRLLSYGALDPMQFSTDAPDFTVLDWLDNFNTNTGALDMMTSQWAAMLASGWPFFRELSHVRRKLRAHLFDKDEPDRWKRVKERSNGCDDLDSGMDREYADAVRLSLESAGEPTISLEAHLHVLWRGTKCPLGMAVAYLSVALHWIRRDQYQGSLKDQDNHVLQFIIFAQTSIADFAQSKSNWSPYFDMLTTHWPFWELLSELACVNTERACVSRSAWQCFDMLQRVYVPCPYKRPQAKQTFTACGEHDVCSWPIAEFPTASDWCVPFDRRPPEPRKPWLLGIGHDAEERICSQCGQDGVLQFIFSHVGFRDEAGLGSNVGRPPFFVEFGARKPDMLNSAVLRRFCAWDGVLLDSQPGETPHGGCPGCPGIAELVRTEFVTAENVVGLFSKHKVPHDFDLLTVDTDYNDYWILKAILMDGTFRPRVVAVDFNPDIPLSDAKVVRYEPMGEWDGSVYTVASLLAYALLARAHGYVFAYALEMGAHAFFIRKDLLAEADHDLPLRKVQKASHPPDKLGREFVDVLYDFLPKAPNSSAVVFQDQEVIGDTDKLELASLQQEVRELAQEVRALRSYLLPPSATSGKATAAVGFESRRSTPTPKTGAKLFYDSVRHDDF